MTTTNENATNKTPDQVRFAAEHARRAFNHLCDRALDDMRELIATVRHRLGRDERAAEHER